MPPYLSLFERMLVNVCLASMINDNVRQLLLQFFYSEKRD